MIQPVIIIIDATMHYLLYTWPCGESVCIRAGRDKDSAALPCPKHGNGERPCRHWGHNEQGGGG